MYQRTNYLEKRDAADFTPPMRISSVAPRWSKNPFAFPSSPPPPVPQCQTMSYDGAATMDVPDIQRSSSGGYFAAPCQRSSAEKSNMSAMSCLRAADLMAQFEMADEEEKEESLNRKADFKSAMMPSLGAGLGNAQLALAQAQKAQKDAQERKDPALVDIRRTRSTETPSSQALPALDQIKARSFDGVEDATTKPVKKTRAQQRIDKARATRIRIVAEKAGKELPNEVGVDAVPLSASNETPPFRTQPALEGVNPHKFGGDEATIKPVKKTRAQQRIDKARATRMRIIAEMADKELPSEVGVDVVPLKRGGYSVQDSPASPRSVVVPNSSWRDYDEDHLLC